MLKLIGIQITPAIAWWWLLLLMAVGFIMIIFGGNWFVDSAIGLSKIAKIPPIIIGATIVSIGTTLPELCVSVLAAIEGNTAVALGNAAGSPLCNTALILGIVLAFSSARLNRKQFMPKIIYLFLSVSFLTLFVVFGRVLNILECVVLLILFVIFAGYCVFEAKKNPMAQMEEEQEKTKRPVLLILFFVLGAAGIALGASFLVDSVTAIALTAGIPDQVIAITVVALGTSLPELVTAINAVKKKTPEISIGNIIGANIINITLITGLSGIIAGGAQIPDTDFAGFIAALIVLLVSLVIVMLPVCIKRRTYKFQGVAMLILYAGYIAFLIIDLFSPGFFL